MDQDENLWGGVIIIAAIVAAISVFVLLALPNLLYYQIDFNLKNLVSMWMILFAFHILKRL